MKDNKPVENSDEARQKYFMDVDRMINEGLGGGTVSPRENSGEIEQTRDLDREEAPHEAEND
ncbi:hypothetical protein CR194_03840 [Salipaludibacillus keqinensis]|uniref:Uncharacterized protein n=1 Tax=Salipaludibacillus keqinensis TaxID=2045207 RepID=A0A323THR7_9BACI|nr:hypothetical protein [Salipaludibacillus keqinensis]PYZ94672.1 hypothetical protein CR194_03840 [Salipaludibacillus keqinensis]